LSAGHDAVRQYDDWSYVLSGRAGVPYGLPDRELVLFKYNHAVLQDLPGGLQPQLRVLQRVLLFEQGQALWVRVQR
jgi:hypothetical protein